MIDLLLKNILTFHEQLEAGKGIRDLGLVESAVNAPFQTFGGQSLYPTILTRRRDFFTAWSKTTASSTATNASPPMR